MRHAPLCAFPAYAAGAAVPGTATADKPAGFQPRKKTPPPPHTHTQKKKKKKFFTGVHNLAPFSCHLLHTGQLSICQLTLNETTKTSVLAEYLGRIDGGITACQSRCHGMTGTTTKLCWSCSATPTNCRRPTMPGLSVQRGSSGNLRRPATQSPDLDPPHPLCRLV